MSIYKASDVRHGDSIFLEDDKSSREVMRVSTGMITISTSDGVADREVTEIKFTDGTKLITKPDATVLILDRIGTLEPTMH